MESIAFGKQRRLDAINIPNRGWIPNLPDQMVVEVPATKSSTSFGARES
jgi:alpha-galactosidase